jgi:hypothetical protein
MAMNKIIHYITGFGGCISEFEIDEAATPLNGTTNRFVIETSSGVENGCSGQQYEGYGCVMPISTMLQVY